MQPQQGNTAIDRFIQWLRGSWGELAKWRGANDTRTAVPDQTGNAARHTATGHIQGQSAASDDVAANGAPDREPAGGTGASQDEFASGGYTPENPDLETVEEAADGPLDPERGDGKSAGEESSEEDVTAVLLVDQEMDQPTPPSGNYGVGNLGLGSRASLGEAPFVDDGDDLAASIDDESVPDADEGIDLAAAAISDDTDARQPGVIDGTALVDAAPGLGGATGAEAFSTIDDQNVRGIGDLGAEELGSLEELEEDAVAFADVADERFDANSQPAFESDLPESVAEIGDEADDYSSPALEDSGMRIVDEDDAGLTLREPADDEFVDSGSVIAESAHDTEDARPLSDFTQQGSGFASESNEPTGAAGDRSDEPFGSKTGADTAETWVEGEATENLGAAGELKALDFGSTAGEPDSPLAATGLFGESDIDVSDLSYLDVSENARYDFSKLVTDEMPESPDVPESAGVIDDIGASPTGMSDAAGPVESDEPAGGDVPAATTTDPDDIPDSAADTADDIADSPTGVVDAEATRSVDEAGGPRGNIPSFATDKDNEPTSPVTATVATRTGPGGSVRGDDGGTCPDDYPIKGNSSSKVYHVPGIPSHQGTKAEWCFASEEQAQAAGYRPPGQRNRGAGSSASRRGRGR